MRRQAGRVHWMVWLFIGIVAIFAAVALAPVVGELRRPPYQRPADEFMRALARNEFEAAARVVDKATMPKEKQDIKKAWQEKQQYGWGAITSVELVDAVQAPAELKHPRAAQSWRIEYHVQGELT
ncbi:MAG: hypothetical protein NZL85_03185, partial [Fimbriimonadales bacterium]|nr:hypothetical protein [Fimbriimonadales bacterium]